MHQEFCQAFVNMYCCNMCLAETFAEKLHDWWWVHRSLTVKTVRYLLEEDLGLEPDGLDVHKQFIRKLVDLANFLMQDCIFLLFLAF